MRIPAIAAALAASVLLGTGALAQATHYSTSTTRLGTLLADPAAKAVVARYFPELIASTKVRMGLANRMTLRSLKRFRPKSFSDDRLAAADAAFVALPAK